MLHRILMGLYFASLSLLTACGLSDTSKSNLDGHYEDATPLNMRSFEDGQTAVAEYQPVAGVIIALPLLTTYKKEQMAVDIINSGVDTLWITVPNSYSGTLESRDFDELRRLLGSKFSRVKLIRQKAAGSVSIWARDWSPLGARASDGSLRLIDFNYYPERGADDSTARSMLDLLPVPRVSVPVYNEGGNFMNNSRGVCMMTSRVTDANEFRHFTDDMVLGDEEIRDYYGRFAGCSETLIFPRMPTEGTGHIDMWAKFLNDETIIVGEIRSEIMRLQDYNQKQLATVKEVKDYLDLRALEIQNRGFKVVRIPMPAPVWTGNDVMFRSYTNSLTTNNVALVPRYVAPDFSISDSDTYIDQQLLAKYELEVINAYRKLGYIFKWVNSDSMIAAGGAVHCTTMQIAR